MLEAHAPQGDFVLAARCGKGPVALISAGVGLTPLLAMLHELTTAAAATTTTTSPSIFWIHGARDGANHAFAGEVRALAAGNGNVKTHVVFSRPAVGDRCCVDFDARDRVDAGLVAELLGDVVADYFVCGPATVMAAIQQDLGYRGVAHDRIHTESFGPAAHALDPRS